jgi:molybdate transport system ATP-binding protein
MTRHDSVISVRFEGVLDRFELDVAFQVPMHGITALFGPSGSGKTTVLRCVSGLARLPGRLVVGDEVWQDGNRMFREPYHRPIGYVFQEPSLFPHLSVRRNLIYGRQRALKAGASEEIRFDDVVGLMGIGHLLDRATAALSGGERQRVAIGRALLAQPRLLLMDEPLSALDRTSKEELLPYFEALHETLAIPILYVSHDISEVERLADILVLLDQGRVIVSGALADVLADGRLPIARSAEAATVVEASVMTFDPQYGLTQMDVEGEPLLVPGRVGERGKMRRIRIAAADVSLAPDRPSQTSILNVLPARVKGIYPVDDAQVNIVIALGRRETGTSLLARISRRAYETLGFTPGQDVYAQVKAVSLIAPGRSSSQDNRAASAESAQTEGTAKVHW